MNAVLIVLTILAAVLFVALLTVAVFMPLGKAISRRRNQDVNEEALPFDKVPSRTMAEKDLVWEDRRSGPRRSGHDRRQGDDGISDDADRRKEDRREGDRRKVNIPPPYPENE